jgi:glycosyltransferase involved in cell wall biosynthesis
MFGGAILLFFHYFAFSMEKLRILILNASRIYGGGEYYTFQLAMQFTENGHFVLVGCKNDNLLFEKCAGSGIPAENINFGKTGNKRLKENITSIKNLAKKNNIQIVHTNTVIDRTPGAAAARIAGAKHITSCHSLLSVQHNLTHYIRNKYFTSAFIADGISIKELLIKKDKIEPVKVHVINNGIEPDEMRRDESQRKLNRDSLGIKENEIAIGCAARFVYFKGHRYLFNAFAVLLEKYKNIKLVLTGDGELQQELVEYARILKISGHVIFSGFREDLNNIYSAYDIFTHPSIEGGGELFPYTVLYAMAQKLPIVSTSIGDIPFMIEDGKSGFIVKEKSAMELAEKLEVLIIEAGMREKFGREAYTRLINNFTIEQTTEKTEKLYYNILNDQGELK